MAKNTTTVTHEDGTTSTRTSQSRTYTHAVVISRTRESLVQAALRHATDRDDAAAVAEKAATGEITEKTRPWAQGKLTYTDLYVGGEWAGAHVSDEPRPTDDKLRSNLRERADQARRKAATHRAEAETLAAGPDMTYGVLRWSSRADLAERAASGEFAALAGAGVTIYVQPVDAAA